jgi:NAD(P)-dependent dehydrogenase (short-subunit alcohol dehydrogenase family)
MPLAVVTGSAGGIGQAVCKVLEVRAAACAPRDASVLFARSRTHAPPPRQAAGYTVVGVDQTPSPALRGANCHEFVCDIRDLMPSEEKADDAEEGVSAAVCESVGPKRGTSAPRALKALLASLASSSSGTKVDLLVNNAACQARACHTCRAPAPLCSCRGVGARRAAARCAARPARRAPAQHAPASTPVCAPHATRARSRARPFTYSPARVCARSAFLFFRARACAQIVAPMAEISLADWTNVMSTNLTAPFMITKLLLPELQVRLVSTRMRLLLWTGGRFRRRR